MAMQGTVTELGLSKSGKPKVKINGEWYSIKTNQGYGVGSVLDFEASDFQFNGRTFHGIDKFAVLPAPLQNPPLSDHWKQGPTTPVNAMPSGPIPAGYTEPARMFVSNIVAAAINAGKLEDPVDLPAWVNAALYAIRHAKGELTMPLDKDVDF